MTTTMQRLLTDKTRLPGFSDEWERRRFGDVGTFLSTANNPRADLDEHGTVGYVHYGNVHAHPLPVLNCANHDLPRIEESRVGNVSRLQDGDLVIVDASEDLNGLGKSVEVMGVGHDNIVAGLHTILYRGDSDHWAAGFKAYLQYISEFKSALTRVAAGISVYAVSKKQLADVVLTLPPPHEQRAIAEALSDVDGLIESLESLIAKKRAVKTATMQQLLTGKTRLPGFSDEWETKRIGDFTDCTAGGTPSTLISEYWGGAIRWMNSGELNDKIVHDVEGRITNRGLRESSTKIVPRKCVLVGLAGQGKTRGTVAFSTIELCVNQSIAAIYPNESFFPEYLYHNLDARYDELRGMSTGDGGRGGLNLQIIRAIELLFPAIDEQRAIAAILSDMDAEIAALEQRREKTRALKRSMMQQLLTGKIRLAESVET